MWPSLYLSIYLSIYLPLSVVYDGPPAGDMPRRAAELYGRSRWNLSLDLSIFLPLSIYLSIYLYLYLSIYLSIYPSQKRGSRNCADSAHGRSRWNRDLSLSIYLSTLSMVYLQIWIVIRVRLGVLSCACVCRFGGVFSVDVSCVRVTCWLFYIYITTPGLQVNIYSHIYNDPKLQARILSPSRIYISIYLSIYLPLSIVYLQIMNWYSQTKPTDAPGGI